MSLHRFTLAALLILTPPAAGAADDEIVATHRPKVAAETPETKTEAVTAEDTAKTMQAQVLSTLSDARPVDRIQPTSWGREEETDAGPRKRQIHGEAGASIGTGGYKSAYVSALIPVGDTGTLGIAYSQTDHGKNGYWYADPYGYDYDPGYAPGYGRFGASHRDPYGYGYGPGTGYARGGTSKSLSISLDLSARDKDRERDAECDTVRYESSPGESIWGGYRPSRRVCTKTTNYPY
ncbi:hypothetical protein [Asticcacaulis sp. AND118]|uniref:hypothetical protein n=1 Tax=Asticcacaulis sp. AND118 TaxID=2840468 RepID=UPI001CFFE336|nr:hypothetical protein [Asticcacaulis sp. AND118]UDF05471.1 hypothetical protein LH365_14825 [Asticcacaulis sp. AND118]